MDTNDTNGEDSSLLFKELSYRIVGAAMDVHNELGFGFLEKLYENAMMIVLREKGIKAVQQFPIPVRFHGEIIGDYFADILVDNSVVLELKAQDRISEVHKVQALHYLKATGFRLALLINFGKHRLEYERLVL